MRQEGLSVPEVGGEQVMPSAYTRGSAARVHARYVADRVDATQHNRQEPQEDDRDDELKAGRISDDDTSLDNRKVHGRTA